MQVQESNNTTYVKGVSSYVINSDDDFILVDCSAGPVSLYLPNINGAGLMYKPKIFYITDYSGNSATNNITIYPTGANEINNAASFVIDENGLACECQVASLTEWLILTDNDSGGGTTITIIDYDLAGTTNINLIGRTGELIINLSDSISPLSATLATISNFTAVTKVTIRPVDLLELTVTGINPSIILSAAALTVYGAHQGFLELTKRLVGATNSFYQTNYLDQYYT